MIDQEGKIKMASQTVFQPPVTSRDQGGLGNSGQPLCSKSLNENESR